MNTKISVIIPVYNVKDYISYCLDSIINQTFNNIEIICVNDCSTDNSLDILKEYAKKDSRIVLIDKAVNEGTMLARKAGVDMATGEYIIFVDSDDYIDLHLCQFINDITAKEDADIIQFSSGVYNKMSNSSISAMENVLKPLEKKLTGIEILEHAFIKKTYSTSLWGKIFKTDLCKKACSLLPDEHCHVGEDIFTYFYMAMFAKKYVGIKTPNYYFYRFGLGVSGQNMIELSKFEPFVKMSVWVRYIEQQFKTFCPNAVQQKAYENLKKRLFADCCEIFNRIASKKDKIAAIDLIYENWHDIDISNDDWIKYVGKSKEYIKNQYFISEYYKQAQSFENKSAKVTVAVYIHNGSEMLPQKLNPIFNQSLQDIEYILINDGSEDNSLEIIEKYAEKSNTAIINQKYRGFSVSANKVLSYANGEYIYFADLNNVLDETFIEEAYDNAQKHNADIVSFDGLYSNKCISGEELLAESAEKNISLSNLSTKLLRKSFIKESNLLFDESISRGNEIFFPLLLIKAKTVLCLQRHNLDKANTKQHNFTVDDFIEYFIIYTNLAANNIIFSYANKTKKALAKICNDFYKISNEIFFNLSNDEIMEINKILPEEYKAMLFDKREFRMVKSSLSYKLSNKIISIVSKITAK